MPISITAACCRSWCAKAFAGQDSCDARHHRSVLLHAARCRRHPGKRGRDSQPAQRRARAGSGVSRSTPRPTPFAVAGVVPAGRISSNGSKFYRASAPATGTPATSRLRLDRDWSLRHEGRRRAAAARFSLPATSAPTPSCCETSPGSAYRIRLRHFGIHLWRQGAAGDHAAIAGATALAAEVRQAQAADGALLIPAFAVERTQELIVDLVDLMQRGEIPAAPIFLDSRSPSAPPRCSASTRRNSTPRSTSQPFCARRICVSPRPSSESKAIERLSGFHIIIAASGMCDAGRIRHHLKRWLWNAKGDRAAGRLSGPRNARPVPCGWREGRAHPGRGNQGRGAHSPDRRIFGSCRRSGTGALDRRAAADSSRRCFSSTAKSRRWPDCWPRHRRADHSRSEDLPAGSGRRLRSIDHRADPARCEATAAGWRPRPLLRSIGTTTCRSSSSTSTTRSRRPPMTAPAASSFEG